MKKEKAFRVDAVVDRIEGKTAYLQFPDGTSALWPLGKLPEGISEGNRLLIMLEWDRRKGG
jgi:hypothetical protein